MSGVIAVVYIAVIVIELIAMWKLMTKAECPGWAIFIPFYNSYTLFKIVYGNGWKFLLLLIPIANIFFMIKFYFDLAKVFGQKTAFGFGLLFCPYIFIPIIAFSENIRYIGPRE